MRYRLPWRWPRVAVLLLAGIAVIATAIAMFPLTLRDIPGSTQEWNRLSAIAQTYTGAAAIISVIALAGVAASLMLQSRANMVIREQANRAVHIELLKMAMSDPLYCRAWGPFFASDDFDEAREHMYVNLIISSWQSRWRTYGTTEESLRVSMHVLFSGETGRRFWVTAREIRMKAPASRREAKFDQILEEEYQLAGINPASSPRLPEPEATGSPRLARTPKPPRPGNGDGGHQAGLVVATIIGLAVIILRIVKKRPFA